jgi:site-specific DNA recombinase
MNQIKYVLYARKSTEGDKKQVQSLPAQIREMKAIAKRDKLNIVEIIEEEKSAKTPGKRPGFNRMVKLIEQGKVNGVLSYEISRLTRSALEGGQIAQLLHDEKLLSIKTCNNEYLPGDNVLLMNIEQGMATQYIRDMKRNILRGIKQKAMSGGISNQAPQGYVNVYGKKIIQPDPLRFPLIKKAFDMVLAGHTPQEARRALTEDFGYTSLTTGKPISYAGIYTILANPRYAGKVPDPHEPNVYYEGNYQPMITAEEYDKVQQILGYKGKPRLCETKYFALRGILRCGECGCAITPQEKHKTLADGSRRSYTYYRCTMKKPCTQKKSIREEDLFKQADELLARYTLSPELYAWGMEALGEIAKKESAERYNVNASQIETEKSITKQLDGLLDKFVLDQVSSDDYERKSKVLKNRLSELQAEQKASQERSANWYQVVGQTLEKLTDADKKFIESTNSIKRNILEALGPRPILLSGLINIETFPWIDSLIDSFEHDKQLGDIERVIKSSI